MQENDIIDALESMDLRQLEQMGAQIRRIRRQREIALMQEYRTRWAEPRLIIKPTNGKTK